MLRSAGRTIAAEKSGTNSQTRFWKNQSGTRDKSAITRLIPYIIHKARGVCRKLIRKMRHRKLNNLIRTSSDWSRPCLRAYASENSDCSATCATAKSDLSRNLERDKTPPTIKVSATSYHSCAPTAWLSDTSIPLLTRPR
jgi:hypothetical protein